jgi:hydroxymethylpyrimidine pyrophosphatase-like HAD family hydrolase
MSLIITPSPGQSPTATPASPEFGEEAGKECLPQAEQDFYQGYSWCLNPFPTLAETVELLSGEIEKLGNGRGDWREAEVRTNVFLLSCALLNGVDEYLRGKAVRLPKSLAAAPWARIGARAAESLGSFPRWRRRARVRRWRQSWRNRLDAFLGAFVTETPDTIAIADAGRSLALLLGSPLPAELQAEPIYFPSAFRRLDLTHLDVLALGRRFLARFPDRHQPILLLGLRTAGSYFAPLLCASLKAEGCRTVDYVTVHPVKGPGARERGQLIRFARSGYLAVILDDPPHTGDSIVKVVDMAGRAGFPPAKIVVAVPAHPGRRDWSEFRFHADTVIVSLDPEEWHKKRLLGLAEVRLKEYYHERRFSDVRLVASRAADRFNAHVQESSGADVRGPRLKRVYEIRLETPAGETETRYVLAKSVGWGWLGYHAFLAGQRLSGFVPPMLGLRDGIVYSEWIPQPSQDQRDPAFPFSPVFEGEGQGEGERGPARRSNVFAPTPAPSPPPLSPEAGERREQEQWIKTTAAYVAARVRSLGLGKDPLPMLGRHRHHDGFAHLEKVLSRAFGRLLTAGLMRPRVRHRLATEACPYPTLIDGRMRGSEWIAGPHGLLKTDYEHHGLGKNELNMIDPAYDLAEAILHLGASPEEEERLIDHYVEQSGDADVRSRLFISKFLAGSWAMESAVKGLFGHPERAHQQKLNEQFVDALHFLTAQTARFCGQRCRPPRTPHWRSPLVALDIDGVLDRWIFGFPCTSAAGIQALSLLHAHAFAIAVNTARSALEVQEYCRAYGFVGGVAEYGSYVWDAVGQKGRTLVSPESGHQLDKARKALRQLPGVFVDDRYQSSIRAYTYEDKRAMLGRLPIPSPLRAVLAVGFDEKVPVPLPSLTVQQLLADLGLGRLSVHQTTIDTTIRAREVNKGTGWSALLDWVGQTEAETIAIGDSEPDLPLFRVASQSFAPSHISCARQARLLGCRIAPDPYQRGLLSIVRSLVHPKGGRCPRCNASAKLWPSGKDLFLDLLAAIDWKRPTALLRALLDPKAYGVLMR